MEIFSGKCRKHPSGNQQPGICSACLGDRLMQLADAYNHSTAFDAKHPFTADDRYSTFSSTSTSSSSPIYLSNFSDHSPDRRWANHARNASVVMKSISYVRGGRGELLKKSRSIATTVVVVEGGCDGKRMNRGSFWKKLLLMRERRWSKETHGKARTLKDLLDE